MRIALVHQQAEGGATVIARSLAERLRQGGVETLYLGPPPGQPGEQLFEQLDHFRPDVVHLHCFFNTYGYAILEPLAQRYPILFTVHDLFPMNQHFTACWSCRRFRFCLPCPQVGPVKGLRIFRQRLAKRRVHRGVQAHLAVPSRWLEERLRATELGRLPVHHVPYGIDLEVFRRREQARERLGLPGDARILLFAGNMYTPEDDRKGLPDVLAVLDGIRQQVPGTLLVVIGQVYGVDPREDMRVFGSLEAERMPDAFSAADVFVNPTRGETGGITNMEAAACGAAVVSTRATAVPEYVAEGRNGLLVPLGDRPALARAVVELLSDAERARAMGAEGVRLAHERFGLDTMTRRYRDIYAQVAARDQAPARPSSAAR
jgi:glycosyltransferase involved in cell wall biosynthesis